MTVPRTGLVDWRLPVSGPSAVLLAARLEADGIQLDLGGPGRAPWLDDPARLDELRAALAGSGVAPLGVSVNTLNDLGLTAEDGTETAGQVALMITRALDVAEGLGADLVFLPSFRRSSIDGPAALARTAEVLRWACAQASGRGLLLATENVLAPARLWELVERVGSPALRVMLDTGNLLTAGLNPTELVRAAGPLLAGQVHVKNSADRQPLDIGEPGVLGALAELALGVDTVDALVLENDYRDGDLGRLRADLDWLRARRGAHSPTDAGHVPRAGPAGSLGPRVR